jgi:hypothetical protein
VSIADDVALALSPTDSCRDRLAAFYRCRDRQSLQLVVAVALHQAVDLEGIRMWSRAEGSLVLTTLLLLQPGYAYVPYSSLESVVASPSGSPSG